MLPIAGAALSAVAVYAVVLVGGMLTGMAAVLVVWLIRGSLG